MSRWLLGFGLGYCAESGNERRDSGVLCLCFMCDLSMWTLDVLTWNLCLESDYIVRFMCGLLYVLSLIGKPSYP